MQYTTRAGDTFESIAISLLNTGGDAAIVGAYAAGLANQAGMTDDSGNNPYPSNQPIIAGITFTIPDSWLRIQPTNPAPTGFSFGGFTPQQLILGGAVLWIMIGAMK